MDTILSLLALLIGAMVVSALGTRMSLYLGYGKDSFPRQP